MIFLRSLIKWCAMSYLTLDTRVKNFRLKCTGHNGPLTQISTQDPLGA